MPWMWAWMSVRCTHIRSLEHAFYFAVFIVFIYFQVSLDVFQVFKGDVKWVTREVDIQMPSRSAVIGCYWTLYQLIVDVPTEHLNLFKPNPSLDLNSLSLVVEGNLCCLNFSLAIPPYSVVYDPTAFMACKLVVVTWLIAYGVVMKPRPPCGTAATWWRCSARAGIEVVDQVPLQVTPPYHFCYK